jgi:solute carrier family 25 phosphate transporter 3
MFASIFACILSHPGDVLLTETYRNRSTAISFIDLSKRLYSEKGLEGFFVGLSARLIHVGTIITSQLVVYDFTKQLLGLPATGA